MFSGNGDVSSGVSCPMHVYTYRFWEGDVPVPEGGKRECDVSTQNQYGERHWENVGHQASGEIMSGKGRTWQKTLVRQRDNERRHQRLVRRRIKNRAKHGPHVEPPCDIPIELRASPNKHIARYLVRGGKAHPVTESSYDEDSRRPFEFTLDDAVAKDGTRENARDGNRVGDRPR